MATQYQVFGNTGNGGPIDYSTVLATVSGLSWTPPALKAGSDWSFGVRAVDSTSGLSESNVDARVRITLDANGNDVGALPTPPTIFDCDVVGGNSARLDWGWFDTKYPTPTSFLVFVGSATTPTVTVSASIRSRIYGTTLANLPVGTSTISVVAVVGDTRSLPATTSVMITASKPSTPESLTISTTDQRQQ